MKKWNKAVWMVLLAVAVFLFVVFLPKLDALISNAKYINKTTMVKNDQGNGIHYDLSIQDKLEIISSNQVDAVTQIGGTESLEEINKNDNQLLEALEQEIKILEEKRIIPVIKEKNELKEHLKQASYYSISNKTGSVLSVPVWMLEFLGEGSAGYKFVVDAATYKIYALSLCVTDEAIGEFFTQCEKDPKPRETTAEFIFIENMLNKMADYYEADSGYVASMNGLKFYTRLKYKDDFKGVNVDFHYNMMYGGDTLDGVPYFEGYQYVEMYVANGEKILEGYNNKY